MKGTFDVSVVICAYTEERWHELVEAVTSIQRQSIPPREFIVVVDHNQCLLERVQRHFPGIIAIENSEPPGLSGARNSGIARAQGTFIAFLDDDAIAAPDWLLMLSEEFTDPQVLGIGGSVLPLWLNEAPAWLPQEFYWIVGCTYRGMPQTARTIRNPIGANMAFRREVFETVGGFRSGIGRIGTQPFGCEETELCIRARQYWPQKIIRYKPQASVLHHVPENRTSWHYFCARCYAEGFSKAHVTRYVGIKDSLASEYTYTLKALPQGGIRSLKDVLFHHDLTGFGRAGATLIGLAVTAAGYIVGNTLLWTTNCKNVAQGIPG